MILETLTLWPDRPDVTLTAYVHEDSPMLLAGKKRPAVIVCPGGAYMVCAETEGEPVALQFAAMGYHAFVLHYSVYRSAMAQAEPGQEICYETMYPSPALDIGMAVLKLREKAEEWHIDTERIALCGFSAGAHNCAMYLTGYATEEIAASLEAEPEMLRPAAAVLGYGLYDCAPLGAQVPDPQIQGMNRAMCMALLGQRQPSPQLLEAISPIYRANPAVPPCFLWATSEDPVVPVYNTLVMAASLSEQGVPVEVHVFEHGPHAMATADQVSASDREHMDPDAAKWLSLADAWLKKRLALPVE